jgi:hypothetical protein
MILAVGISIYWRNATMLYLFAIASIASRLGTYHRTTYDDLILVFLLMAMGDAVMYSKNRVGLATLAILGLSLWLPARAIAP